MKLILIITLLFQISAIAKKKRSDVYYLNVLYGSIHQNPSSSSTTLTAIACGHPLKLISGHGKSGKKWMKVKAGLHTGYIDEKFLTKKRPECFQDKFPRFFDGLELGVTEYYFWAKLYDNFIMNTSRPEGK